MTVRTLAIALGAGSLMVSPTDTVARRSHCGCVDVEVGRFRFLHVV